MNVIYLLVYCIQSEQYIKALLKKLLKVYIGNPEHSFSANAVVIGISQLGQMMKIRQALQTPFSYCSPNIEVMLLFLLLAKEFLVKLTFFNKKNPLRAFF